MIALWRRLRATAGEIRAAEWLLLSIETVAVVGGILIAFELEQWAEDRREAQQVERLMERLLTETRSAVVHYDYHARETGVRLDRAKANLADFAQGRCPADFTEIEEVELLPADAPPNTALTELVDVVGLSALPSEALKSQLSAYHYASNAFYGEVLPALQQGRIPLFSFDDPDAPRAPDTEALQEDHSFVSQMWSAPSILSRSYDREALCADATFKSRYSGAAQALLEVAALRNDLLLLTLRTCETLASELGQSCLEDTARKAMGPQRVRAIEDSLEAFNATRTTSDPTQ